ncbi:MAG: hypothetical protein AMS22_04300 [Thiotrichales bacterium SG8_50]|nr:MAG: hypothetical protein AMS22_04300 [Thiotrichales bacterium SG8_50]
MNQFELPASLSLSALVAQFQQLGRFVAQPARRVQREYCDTFDWRLYRNSAVVLRERYDSHCSLLWLSLPAEQVECSQPGPAPARLLADLPDGALKRRLAPVIEMRALLPMVCTRARLQVLELRDKQDKTVLRVSLENSMLYHFDKQRWVRLARRLQLQPVRGYDKPLQRIRTRLGKRLALEPAREPVYLLALKRLGVEPGGYSAKPSVELDPAERADLATKRILLQLLDTIETNEMGTKDDLDSEFLHDFRVAVRRTRAALAQIKGVFAPATLARFREGFAWLGAITGPTRDLDVYLLRMPAYQTSLPPVRRDDLRPLDEFLAAHQRDEQRILRAQLSSARYRRLVRGWRGFLLRPVPQRSRLANAQRPIGEVASERIWRMYRRVIKEGRAIDADSPDEALHELRKTCKKLRYLMEFFVSLYESGKMASLIGELKLLQDNLGDFQDYHVQIGSLDQFMLRMEEEQPLSADTREAIALLKERLFEHQEHARRAFHDVFGRFAGAEVDDAFGTLFRRATTAEHV